MSLFVLIEMADIELTRVRLFSTGEAARAAFDSVCEENKLTESDWRSDFEISGTVTIAGDDSYSVQLIERGVEQ
jgi:hypothetical protein